MKFIKALMKIENVYIDTNILFEKLKDFEEFKEENKEKKLMPLMVEKKQLFYNAKDSRHKKMNKILKYLKKNSRTPLTTISEKTGIPLATCHDIMNDMKDDFNFTIERK